MRVKSILLATLALAAALGAPTSAFAQAAGEASAVPDRSCDRACLIGHLKGFMAALGAGDASRLPLAGRVTYTENNVAIGLDEGLWGTVTAVDAVGLETADPSTGNAAWFGSVKENGNPAIYAVRIHVSDGRIDEVEAVVHRKTALPAPFGDVTKMVHDPEFQAILPPEERKTRERMLAIADGYFDTVEVNDGQVMTHFAEDCGRLENGISTTAPTPGSTGGNAAALASGCEAQFKLGLYRINKRIRRDLFIVDEERGVVVGRGFFDHANEWDRYKLTDGREMRTALKWPNSISLIEAFRIRNGEIQRIEAVFTYVPYFMHNPFWGPDNPPPGAKVDPKACDAACVTVNTQSVMAAYPVRGAWEKLPWADRVAYAENSVGIRINEGIWQGVTAVDPNPLIVADAETGNGVWIGKIEEHGQPAWAAITVSNEGKQIAGIDALIRRKEYGPLWAEPAAAPTYAALTQAQRTPRETMLGLAEGMYGAINSHAGKPPEGLADGCTWIINGQNVGACAPPFSGPGLGSIARVRDRRLLALDEARGLLVYQTFEDMPATGGQSYPRTMQVVELFRIEGGQITQILAYTSELPYGMKPHR